jgi:DNA-binding MarR family transcriptional regulator
VPKTRGRDRQVKTDDQPMCVGLPAGAPDPAARRLLDGIQLLVRRFAISERADVNCCGLTVAQAATLQALEEGPLRLTDLGRRLGITASTLTRNLGRLEDARLVAREADPDDARAARARLTGAGRAAAAQVDRQEEAFAQSVLDRLPPARRGAALAGLSDLLIAVRAATEHCCPGAFDHLMTDFPAPGRAPDAARGGANDCGCD